MTASQATEQKTMEEILASIRQIISDDEAKVAKRTAAPEARPAEAITPEPAASGQDKISRLFDRDGPPRPRLVDHGVPRRPEAAEQPVDAAIDRAMGAPGSGNLLARSVSAASNAAAKAAEPNVSPFRPPEAPSPVREEERGDHGPLPRIVPPEAGETRATAPEPLLSSAAESAVGGSFEDLAAAARSAAGRPLAALVEKTLRPMLKSWLDENLPPLVERLVREEIERVSRGRR